MFFTLFIVSCFVAFASLAWKETLNTFPVLKNGIRKRLSVIARKPLFCGFCFTSWLAFFATITLFSIKRFGFFEHAFSVLNFFFAWGAIAMMALFIRYVVLAVEEFVHWEVHTLNGQVDDLH